MFTIRPAEKTEFYPVCRFYHALIDAIQSAPYHPGWEKDVYPADADLRAAISAGQLHIGLLDGRIGAAMVLNLECLEHYGRVAWPVTAEADRVLFLHLLCVHPALRGKGYAKALVSRALSLAKEGGNRALRLDVLSENLPARSLYRSLGFRYVDTLRVSFPDAGQMTFELYEHPLEG